MRKLIAIALVLAAVFTLWAGPVGAANPTVSITVTAHVVSITNTQSSWAIGVVETDDVVYFSTDGNQDDDWSQVENTGSVACDVEIQGTNIEGGSYDWTLAAAAGSETYSLYANSESTPTVYDVEVKSSTYNDLCTSLAASDTYDWSMKFTAPTAFNANDDGEQKSGTVTLVASKAT